MSAGRCCSSGGGGKGPRVEMDGWMVYCIINGLTITILWVNDDEHD